MIEVTWLWAGCPINVSMATGLQIVCVCTWLGKNYLDFGGAGCSGHVFNDSRTLFTLQIS